MTRTPFLVASVYSCLAVWGGRSLGSSFCLAWETKRVNVAKNTLVSNGVQVKSDNRHPTDNVRPCRFVSIKPTSGNFAPACLLSPSMTNSGVWVFTDYVDGEKREIENQRHKSKKSSKNVTANYG